MTDSEDVKARLDQALRDAAARAYQAAAGVVDDSLLDAPQRRLRWSITPRVALTVVLVLATIAAVVHFAPPRTSGEGAAGTGSRDAANIATAPSQSQLAPGAAPASFGLVVVHVSGHVKQPGVYELDVGDRVSDAIDAAGGPSADADLDSINLARVLSDGEQIRVAAVGESAAGGAGGAGRAVGGGGAININSADAAALETLPGVGPVLASKIIAYRESNGPFKSPQDLDDVSGIGPALLEQIVPLVTV